MSDKGWQPNEAVTLVFSESPPNDPNVTITAATDANGNLDSEAFYVPDNSTPSITYTVTASDSSGTTLQTSFVDNAPTGALCADVAGHGASVCPTATGATGVVVPHGGSDVTVYTQEAGSTATYQIIWKSTDTPDYQAKTVVGTCAAGQVKILIATTPITGTVVCGTIGGTGGRIVTFSWTAPATVCGDVTVRYKNGTTGAGSDQFTHTDSVIVETGADGTFTGRPAGIAYVPVGGTTELGCNIASVTTEIEDAAENIITTPGRHSRHGA